MREQVRRVFRLSHVRHRLEDRQSLVERRLKPGIGDPV